MATQAASVTLTLERRLTYWQASTRYATAHVCTHSALPQCAALETIAKLGIQDISFANPPALYFSSFTPVGFTLPDGGNASQWWNWTRGVEGRWLRGVFEVDPRADAGYVVGDIVIQGKGAKLAMASYASCSY